MDDQTLRAISLPKLLPLLLLLLPLGCEREPGPHATRFVLGAPRDCTLGRELRRNEASFCHMECTLQAACASCHGEARRDGGLSLTVGYSALIDLTSANYSRQQGARLFPYDLITPGEPEHSLLYLKLLTQPERDNLLGQDTALGATMPMGGALFPNDLENIWRWIDEGAREGTPEDCEAEYGAEDSGPSPEGERQ